MEGAGDGGWIDMERVHDTSSHVAGHVMHFCFYGGAEFRFEHLSGGGGNGVYPVGRVGDFVDQSA